MPSTDRRLELKAKDIDDSDRLTAGCVLIDLASPAVSWTSVYANGLSDAYLYIVQCYISLLLSAEGPRKYYLMLLSHKMRLSIVQCYLAMLQLLYRDPENIIDDFLQQFLSIANNCVYFTVLAYDVTVS